MYEKIKLKLKIPLDTSGIV